MPPVRRYLRLTSHTVLEVRIYLDNPADASRWLLHPADPALPRIISAIRPLALPKLREENERAKGKGGGKGRKKGAVRDVVAGDDFEVSIFLTTGNSSGHSILKKQKIIKGEGERKLRQSRIGEGTLDRPVHVREEDGSDEDMRIDSIPPARDDAVSEDAGNKERNDMPQADQEGADEKKKLGFTTTYDGFSIYGRILCLVVKRKAKTKGKEMPGGTGKAMLEGWITSTQARRDEGVLEN